MMHGQRNIKLNLQSIIDQNIKSYLCHKNLNFIVHTATLKLAAFNSEVMLELKEIIFSTWGY